MTAHQLARLLLNGPDLPVTVRGYEGGVDVIEQVDAPRPLHLDGHLGTYYGKSAYCSPESCDSWIMDDEHKVPDTLAIHLGKKE